MKEYRLKVPISGNMYYTVKAESKEEALKIYAEGWNGIVDDGEDLFDEDKPEIIESFDVEENDA